MKFMMMVRASKNYEAGVQLTPEQNVAAAKLMDEMTKAGVLLDRGRLLPSSKGVRIRFNGDKRTVTDGPFAETKELIAGFAFIQVKSMEEAVEWFSRLPYADDREIEIRQMFEPSVAPAADTPRPRA